MKFIKEPLSEELWVLHMEFCQEIDEYLNQEGYLSGYVAKDLVERAIYRSSLILDREK